MFFWNSLAFSMIQWMLAFWSLVPLSFLKPAWTSGCSQFMYCWSMVWRILSITLLMSEMSAIVQWFEHSLALPFFGNGMKTDLFQSCGQCWIFQICWRYWIILPLQIFVLLTQSQYTYPKILKGLCYKFYNGNQ